MNTMERVAQFNGELLRFETETYRAIAVEIIGNLPEYFFTVPASSSGKYHPEFALGEGGLLRHSKVVFRIADDLLGLAQNKEQFDLITRDAIRVACLFHDGLKQGSGKEGHTVKEHPLLMSAILPDWVTTVSNVSPIQELIISHMGEWNEKGTLPVPKTPAQKFVHMCDYLASRKWLDVKI